MLDIQEVLDDLVRLQIDFVTLVALKVKDWVNQMNFVQSPNHLGQLFPFSFLNQQVFNRDQNCLHHSSSFHLNPQIELEKYVGPFDELVEDRLPAQKLVFYEIPGKFDQYQLALFNEVLLFLEADFQQKKQNLLVHEVDAGWLVVSEQT